MPAAEPSRAVDADLHADPAFDLAVHDASTPTSTGGPLGPTARLAARLEGMTGSEVRALFAAAARPGVISLAGGMPFVEAIPPADVLAAGLAAIDEGRADALQYTGGQGLPALRERLSWLASLEGVEAPPDKILVTVGGQQGLDVLGKVFIDPGDPIVVEAPTYVGAIKAFAAYQPRFVTIPLDDEGMRVDVLEAALRDGLRPKFVYTVPNFSNPAGVSMSGDRRARLVRACRAAAVPVVEDNAYGMLRFEGTPPPCLQSIDPETVVYIGSLSKVFAPGLRIGFVSAPLAVLDRLITAKEASDLCTSPMAQIMAAAYVGSPAFGTNLDEMVRTYRSRRDAMLACLVDHMPDGATWTKPEGGFYVWVTLPRGLDTLELLPEASDRGVVYVPGTGFYPDGRGRDQLRLAFSFPDERTIAEGVRRLGTVLRTAARASGRGRLGFEEDGVSFDG